MIAFCGLDYHEYGASLAMMENNDKRRPEVAQEWPRLFKVEVKPEDINCEGCLSDGGRLFNYLPAQEDPSERAMMNAKKITTENSAKVNMLRRVSPKL
jgi:hypothetical protein